MLNFLDLRKFCSAVYKKFDLSVYKMSMLASNVHGAFSLSVNMHAQNI